MYGNEANLVLLRRNVKETIRLPANVVAFRYNDFNRDFSEYRLDYGKIVFEKSLAPQGVVPLRCVYDTRQGIPFWFLMDFQEDLPDGA